MQASPSCPRRVWGVMVVVMVVVVAQRNYHTHYYTPSRGRVGSKKAGFLEKHGKFSSLGDSTDCAGAPARVRVRPPPSEMG